MVSSRSVNEPFLPVSVGPHALVVVGEADGEVPLDGHGHGHVDGRTQGDSIQREVEVGEGQQQPRGVQRREAGAERLQDGEAQVQAVERYQGCNRKNGPFSTVCSNKGKLN